MFESIKSIAVDRKNSLPVADFNARYRVTGTPVVLGDLTQHWQASKKWSQDYLATNAGSLQVPIYSSLVSLNHGSPYQPVLHSSLKVYLEKLRSRKSDFRVSKLPLKSVPKLQGDFLYPRLGFDFNINRTSLSIGGAGVIEPVTQSSSVVHTVRCNFGDRITVLLIPPDQSEFMYRVGHSQNSVRDLNFDQPQFDKFPALRKLSAYVAELDYGDALYIPAGFWCCATYHGVGITLSLEALRGTFTEYVDTASKFIYNRLASSMPSRQARFRRLEKRAVSITNARLST
ncbi:MAG: cupin-like domain-containing protein [Arenicella sp.]|nr:cupin-like domain-containing protein [Arenicella sp.]